MELQSGTSRRWIALLRAINVGGHTVKMEHLRSLFAALGFANVATFIASGNIIFDAAADDSHMLEQQLQRHLKHALGYEVITFLRSTAELATIANYQPFPAAELNAAEHSLYIAFLQTEPSNEAQQALLTFPTDVDEFHIHGREVYWLCRTRLSESVFSGARLEKTLGLPATVRNITTVRKLAAKYPPAQ